MTRRGYDSTTAKDCPNDGTVYGGYNDGAESSNYADQKRLHPHALVFSIGRFTNSRADFYDVENGLLTPEQGAQLSKGNLDRHEFAGNYCNESTWPRMRAALIKLGILDQVAIWLAWETDDEDDKIPSYAVGRQFLLSPGRSPGHYDVSNWVDYVKGLDPVPPPKKPRRTALTYWTRRRLKKATGALAKRTHATIAADDELLEAAEFQIARVRNLPT